MFYRQKFDEKVVRVMEDRLFENLFKLHEYYELPTSRVLSIFYLKSHKFRFLAGKEMVYFK